MNWETFIAFVYSIIIIILKVEGKIEETGWPSLMVVILFASSFQMIALGIIGEYVWRSLEASRKRPVFIVEKVL